MFHDLKKLSKINVIGNANKIPSILSNKPPCPGNIVPVSLTSAFF